MIFEAHIDYNELAHGDEYEGEFGENYALVRPVQSVFSILQKNIASIANGGNFLCPLTLMTLVSNPESMSG